MATAPRPFALVVDDEWRLAQNLALYLERTGYRAQAVTSVTDANTVITECRPDIALIDLKLPDHSGLELCRMLHRRYPGTPLVVMSARIDGPDRSHLDAVGVRHILSKPFALGALAGVLEQIRDTAAIGTVEPLAEPPRTVRQAARPIAAANRSQRPRIDLYSHDTMGLGHMRRNILIAQSLAESRLRANVLLVSGAREIGRFELPTGIDCLVLPSYRKSAAGRYESRHLDMRTKELVRLREHTINASVTAFDPDVMVVDNVPRGALNELDDTLSGINAKGRTRLVLGLRDVLDAPEATRAEWHRRNNLSTVQWHYDEVWVYGDPRVYNLCESYAFGEAFDTKVRFTGYLDARKRANPRASDIVPPEGEDVPPSTPTYNLCLVGGGQDGYALAEAFATAHQPAGTVGVLITGPFMDAEKTARLEQIAAGRPELRILGFVAEPTRLLQNARRVVAMGGYNTVNEVLAFSRPTLIVPRIRPRLEQLVRAERLAVLGHVDMLHPDKLSARAVSQWLAKPDAELPGATDPIDLNGLDRLADYVDRLTARQGIEHAIA